jgi:hypothetical protein
MTNFSDNNISEGYTSTNSIVVDRTITTTANTTTTLTSTSTSQHILTGTTAGQIMKLPDATTLRNGWVYLFWNTSTVLVTVKLNDATTTLATVTAGEQMVVTLQDNSTTNGTWIVARFSGAGGSAAMPMHWGEKGAVGNLYLFEATASTVSSDLVSPPFARNCKIVGYAVNSTALGSTTTLSFRIREGANLVTNKYIINITSGSFVAWDNSGFTTFTAGQRPVVYLNRSSGIATITSPRLVFYYVWTD